MQWNGMECMYVCMNVCMHACMYVCVYLYPCVSLEIYIMGKSKLVLRSAQGLINLIKPIILIMNDHEGKV